MYPSAANASVSVRLVFGPGPVPTIQQYSVTVNGSVPQYSLALASPYSATYSWGVDPTGAALVTLPALALGQPRPTSACFSLYQACPSMNTITFTVVGGQGVVAGAPATTCLLNPGEVMVVAGEGGPARMDDANATVRWVPRVHRLL